MPREDYKIKIDFSSFIGAEIVDAERDGEIRECILIPIRPNGIYASKKKRRNWDAYFKAIRKKPNPRKESHFIRQDITCKTRAERQERGLLEESVVGCFYPAGFRRMQNAKQRESDAEGMADIMAILNQSKK